MAGEEEPLPLSLRLGLGKSSSCCLPPAELEDLHYMWRQCLQGTLFLNYRMEALASLLMALSLGPNPGLGIYWSG